MDVYLNYEIYKLAGTPITVGSLVTLLVIIGITLIVTRIMEAATVRAFRLRKVDDEGTVAVARRLVHYAVLLTGLAVGLDTIGIDLGALFAAGALFAVALGFAMQNIAQNFVSGVILLMERSIKPGDVLEVEGQIVRVSKMGIRSTVARTREDEEILIPNSTLVQSSVKNFTLGDRLFRLRATVGVVYSSDMARVRQTLEKVADSLPWRLGSKKPLVLMRSFGDSSVNFDVSVWIDHPWTAQRRLSELNEAIWWALKENGIIIAFPQIDVHFDPAVVEPLQRLGREA